MNWEKTKRKICIFIPNFKRAKYIESTFNCFETSLSKDEWCIVVANDGSDEKFIPSSKHGNNVFSFTVENDNSRNGCFLRNHAISNCRAQILLQKDPEIYWSSQFDFLKSIADNLQEKQFARASHVAMVSKEETDNIFNKIYNPIQVEPIDTSKYFHIHHLFAARVSDLRAIGGYDANFYKYYGPEDHDIWRRMLNYGCQQFVLPVASLHLYHDRPEMNDARHWEMVQYFNSKDPNEIIANGGIIPHTEIEYYT